MTDGTRAPRPSPRWRRWPIIAAAAVLAVAAAAVFLLGLVTLEHRVGAFGAAFSADGSSVWFVEREARGLSWGLGWEFFTPPAHLHVFSDAMRLRRLDLASGRAVTVETWKRSPLVGRTIDQYRGRLFVTLGAAVRPSGDGAVEYAFGLAVPRVPTSEMHHLRGVWADDARRRRGEWDGAPFAPTGPSEPILHGQRELFVQPGPESFPSAIVILDHADSTIRVVYRPPGSPARGAPALADLLAVSRKPDVDHLEAITRIERERVAAYKAEGASEGEALLRAGRDLRDLGYYPKPERWVATPLSAAQATKHRHLPRVDIDPMAFKVGLFPDLEEAMASPGSEVDRSGSYIRHRDYDASERLNALLDAGTWELMIATDGREFLFQLLPAAPPTIGPGRAAK